MHPKHKGKKKISLKKKWFEKGEVEAKDRPQNSLLKMKLKFRKEKNIEESDFTTDKKEIEKRIREKKFDNSILNTETEEEEFIELSGEGDEEIIEPLLIEFEELIEKFSHPCSL